MAAGDPARPDEGRFSRPPWPSLAAVFGIVFLFFAPVARHEFTLDSGHFLEDDDRVRECRLGKILSTDYWNLGAQAETRNERPGLYRPLTLAWLALMHSITRDEDLLQRRSPPINLANAALHAMGAALRFWLFWLLLRGVVGQAARWSFLAALALGVHPVASEAVATQMGASEGLNMVFATGSSIAVVAALRGGGARAWWLHGGLMLMALLSKESAVALPGVVFLIAWLREGRNLGQSLLATLPGLGALAVWMAVRFAVLGQVAGVNDPVLTLLPVVPRLATAFAMIGSYDLMALFWPTMLHPNLGFLDAPPAAGFGDPWAIVGVVVIVVLTSGFLLARRAPLVALGLGYFGGTFLPVSNLVVLIGALAATRFLYFPMTGLGLALAAGAGTLWMRGGPGRVVGGALWAWFLLVLPFIAWSEVSAWRDPGSLYLATLERYPASALAHFDYGECVRQRGDTASALEHFRTAAAAPVPLIPGREGIAHEDALDTLFKAACNAGSLHVQMGSASLARRDLRAGKEHLDEASRQFDRARDLAGMGRRILEAGARSTTDWDVLHGTVLLLQVEAGLARLGLADERESAASDVRRLLDEAQALGHHDLHVALLEARYDAVSGRITGAAYVERVRGLFEQVIASGGSDSKNVVSVYVDLLRRAGRHADAAVAFLRAVFADRVQTDPGELVLAGLTALKGSAPSTRALGTEALQRYLTGPWPKDPAKRGQAEAALRSLGLR